MWTKERLRMLKHNSKRFEPLGLTTKELDEFERLAFQLNLRGEPLRDAWRERHKDNSAKPLFIPTRNLRRYFEDIYNDIQGTRQRRRDQGYETGWTVNNEGEKWFRNVDPLPSFEEWMGEEGMNLIEA